MIIRLKLPHRVRGGGVNSYPRALGLPSSSRGGSWTDKRAILRGERLIGAAAIVRRLIVIYIRHKYLPIIYYDIHIIIVVHIILSPCQGYWPTIVYYGAYIILLYLRRRIYDRRSARGHVYRTCCIRNIIIINWLHLCRPPYRVRMLKPIKRIRLPTQQTAAK